MWSCTPGPPATRTFDTVWPPSRKGAFLSVRTVPVDNFFLCLRQKKLSFWIVPTDSFSRWGREWVSALCRGRRPRRPRSNTKDKQKRPANPQRFLVGRADPGAPRSSTPFSTNPRRMRSSHFLPPAGEGGSRRSPARRMTEEGEPDRLLTVKSFAYTHSCGHFYIAVPSRSPSPVALVGDTLPRWGREWVSAPWTTAKDRRIRNAPL